MKKVSALPSFTRGQQFIRPLVISRHKDCRPIDLRKHINARFQPARHRGEISGADHNIDLSRLGDDLPGGFKIGVNVAE